MEEIGRQIDECRKDEAFLNRLNLRHEVERELYERLKIESVIRNPRLLADVDVNP